MGIAITLRKDVDTSHFRRYLLHLIQTPNTNRLLLCSGYISEGTYYSVLDDQLLNAITSACSGRKKEVVTIAGRFYNNRQGEQWRNKYERFIQRVDGAHVKVKPYIAPEGNWHAKVAMKLKDDNPVAGIIGSSNLTGPAYREGGRSYNYECDTVIWVKRRSMESYFGQRIPLEVVPGDPFSPIRAVLRPRTPQANEEERLRALYKKILESKLVDYYDWKDERKMRKE